MPVHADRRTLAGVIEARRDLHDQRDLALDRADLTNEGAAVVGIACDRHEVDQLHYAIGAEEPGEQHVRVGEVELLRLGRLGLGRDPEVAAAVCVEERCEHAR
jgi:hypothetical protein